MRSTATQELARIAPEAVSIPALIQALESYQWQDRHTAAAALGRIGPAARETVPILTLVLENDPDDRVRGAAAVALGHIADDTAIKALLKAYHCNSSTGVRLLAGRVLQDVNFDAIVLILDDPNQEMRIYVAEWLGYFSTEPKDAVPALIWILEQDADWRVRHAAAGALGLANPCCHIKVWAESALSALARALREDGDERVRGAAAVALGELAPGCRNLDIAIKALAYAAEEDEHPGLRAIAVTVLADIGPEEEIALVLVHAVPDLVRSLEDERWYVREAAARGLGGVGPRTGAVVPALAKALGDEELLVRKAAVEALGSIGPRTEAVIPALVKALEEDEEPRIRQAAAALEGIGPEAKNAIPALIQALEDEKLRVRAAAAEALKEIAGQDFGTDPKLWQAWWEEQK